MAFCEECGSRVPDGAIQCPACGARVKEPGNPAPTPPTPPAPSATSFTPPTPPRPAPAQGPKLILAENEKVVRQYQCSDIKRPRCSGYLIVTNKRLLFQGKGTTSRISKEVVLDSVSGLDCYYGMNINIPGIILGVLLALCSLMLFGAGSQMIFPGLIVLALGVLLVVSSFQKSFCLSVYSSKANGSPITVGTGPKTLAGNGALYTLASAPTPDTDRMLDELGALVQDLQTLGDHAIEKWSK